MSRYNMMNKTKIIWILPVHEFKWSLTFYQLYA